MIYACHSMLSCSVTSDSAAPWTVACQAPLFMGILQARTLEWVAMPFSRGSSQPRNGTRSPALQVDSLPAEPPGKPKNTGVGSLSLLQGIFPTQESNRGLLHCRRILYQLTYQGSPMIYELLLLLLSRFSRVRLCVTPQTAAHQAPLYLGFSRQEHWSGLPFPSPMHESENSK